MKRYKTVLYIHITAFILSVLILLIIPLDDKLRWNLGYIIRWIVPVSALLLLFLIPQSYPPKKKKGIKIYLKLFWGLPIATAIITAFFWIIGLAYMFLLWIAFIPQSPLIDRGEFYISQTQSMGESSYILYQRRGILETKKEKIKGDIYIKKDSIRLPLHHDPNDTMEKKEKTRWVNSLSYDEKSHRIFFHCSDTTIVYSPSF